MHGKAKEARKTAKCRILSFFAERKCLGFPSEKIKKRGDISTREKKEFLFMDQQQKAKGSVFLKVTGILMIIGGAIGIIVAVTALLGIAAVIAALGGNGVAAGILTAAVIIASVGFVLELVAGIIGVKNNNRPEKANTCLVWGIIVAALTVLSSILSISGGSSDAGSVVLGLITGLVIPVFYIIGEAFNKKELQK